MAYTNTFIRIAPDSNASEGIVPVATGEKKPIHVIQYELLSQNPYHYIHAELVFSVYVSREGISPQELAARGDEIRDTLFQKEHPCLRASALTKKYGWGAHYDENGKIALYSVDSDEYRHFVATCPTVFAALRSKR